MATHEQSGEPSGQVKKEGLKTAPNKEGNELKGRGIRGGDNGQFSEQDMDENETQQAGGQNNGGAVPGAFGNDSKDELKGTSGGQGTMGNTLKH